MRRLALALALAVLAAGCGGGTARDLEVVAWSPDGAIDGADPIEIRFDRPVVPDDLVGEVAAATAVTFTPPIAWRGTWRDRQTLVVQPLSPLAPSTRYRVELAGELRARAGALALTFVHRPLTVEGVWGADPAALAPDADIPLSFDQPVVPAEAAARCRLTGEHGDVALVARSHEPLLDIALHPAHPLLPGAAYTLACAGLTGAGGNAPLERPYTLAVRVRPALAVARVEPAGGAVSPDGVTLAITFTTPVTLDAARDAVTASPPIPGLDRGTLSDDGTTYAVRAELASDTEYHLVIAGLADRAGQHLAQPAEARFHTAIGPPRLVAPRGLVTVDLDSATLRVAARPGEAGAFETGARLPVWTRDLDGFDLACAPIARDRAVVVALGGDAGAVAAPAHHLPAEADHRWHELDLDLASRCGRAPGLYLAELRAPGAGTTRVLANVTDLAVLVDQPSAPLRGAARPGEAGAFDLPSAPLRGAARPGEAGAFDQPSAPPRAFDARPRAGLVWVTSRASGAPVAGARVSVVAADGTAIAAELTGKDGLARLPGRVPGTPPWVITVDEPGDVALAIAGDGATWSFAAGAPDRDDAPGGEDGELPVAPAVPAAPPAPASPEATPPAPRIALALRAAPAAPHVGERLAFELEARTPSGAPVRSARIAWTLRRARHTVQVGGFDDFAFAGDGGEPGTIADGVATTDAHGRLAIAARDPAPPSGAPVDYVLTAIAGDPGEASEAAATSSYVVTAQPASLAIGLRADAIASGPTLDIALVALAPGGLPVDATAHVSILRVERACDAIATPAGRLARCDERRHPVAARDLDLPAGAAREERFELTAPGAYVVRVEARDATGHLAATSRELWMTGAGAAAWEDDGRLEPVASRACYEPGTTARLAARSGLARATALVALEQDGIVDAHVVELGAGADALDLAIAHAFAPGVRARLALVAGARDPDGPRFATGTLDLAVGACGP